MWNLLLVCSRWSVERELIVSNVMLSDKSPALKARLGSIAANPDNTNTNTNTNTKILVTQVKPATSC
jgi:hypothetical protein